MRIAGIVSLLVAAFFVIGLGALLYQDHVEQARVYAAMDARPNMNFREMSDLTQTIPDNSNQEELHGIAGAAFLIAGLALVFGHKKQSE